MRQTLNLIYIALFAPNAGGSNEVAVPFSATADDSQ